MIPKTIEWIGGLAGHVALIDQTLLPGELRVIPCRDVETLAEAIRSLRVRGAPAIGVAAAMGVVLGVRDLADDGDPHVWMDRLNKVCDDLAKTRPTAVNLVWALERMKARAHAHAQLETRHAQLETRHSQLDTRHTELDTRHTELDTRHTELDTRHSKHRTRNTELETLKLALLTEAKAIRDEDAATCRAIGRHGASLIAEGDGILTHCNAGGLATAEFGTALAPMYTAHAQGRSFQVYADETRPLLQGSRLTAWELSRAGIDVTVICDSTAGLLMRQGKVNLVITGADRIAANGDVANKIGTYSLAVLAHAHGIPFYVAAPGSTFDLAASDGSVIPIEERSPEEIRRGFLGRQTAPDDVACYCPAFDVTPANLIRGIITERGRIEPVNGDGIAKMVPAHGC
ncbi:MAG: S-methyl-5-thioribose-1-phosphate isomerase [Phycisphaerae bacterium]